MDLDMFKGEGVRYPEALARVGCHAVEEAVGVEVAAEAVDVGAVGA